jgi:hypothetical protein
MAGVESRRTSGIGRSGEGIAAPRCADRLVKCKIILLTSQVFAIRKRKGVALFWAQRKAIFLDFSGIYQIISCAKTDEEDAGIKHAFSLKRRGINKIAPPSQINLFMRGKRQDKMIGWEWRRGFLCCLQGCCLFPDALQEQEARQMTYCRERENRAITAEDIY